MRMLYFNTAGTKMHYMHPVWDCYLWLRRNKFCTLSCFILYTGLLSLITNAPRIINLNFIVAAFGIKGRLFSHPGTLFCRASQMCSPLNYYIRNVLYCDNFQCGWREEEDFKPVNYWFGSIFNKWLWTWFLSIRMSSLKILKKEQLMVR